MREHLIVLAGAAALVASTTPAIGSATAMHRSGAATSWKRQTSPNPSGTDSQLRGVVALSPRSAWAVGFCRSTCGAGDFRGYVLKWNGTTWARQTTPNPAGDDFLRAIAGVSSRNLWAVGQVRPATQLSDDTKSLILHFNGSAWTRQASPNASSFDNSLLAVAATSKANVWAVGSAGVGPGPYDGKTLIERFTGSHWHIVKSPSPGIGVNVLFGVTATSWSDAWAVGANNNVHANQNPRNYPLIEHWNGKTWAVHSVPFVSTRDVVLTAVSATSKSNAWAVGYYGLAGKEHTLTLHWDGKHWRKVASVSYTNQQSRLFGVSATSASNAWAVGDHDGKTLIEHWNGKKWAIQTTPTVASGGFFPGDELDAVSATSTTNAFAVGDYLKYGTGAVMNYKSLVLHRG